MSMNADGSDQKQLTIGCFHDYYPCLLPDGGLSFVSTRAACRFLCFIPLSFTLHRANADVSEIRPLSFANLSEWGPSIMRDGRILWTRSEYLDKGAKVMVEGRLQLDQWQTDQGEKRSRLRVRADRVQFLSRPKGGAGGGAAAPEPVAEETGMPF